ncbi:sugar phosphate isomerase/epimerase [Akkermansia sp. N21116]|uniref:sugar phosphate isomerase/epimerase family protein n=1 Tax=Akkermansia sp. N21116 TaxID=3040764 RepID=UPI002AC8D06B|nr:sugar phosphate isomerase/epimerase [Akkermansia sp. N21116]WPX40256.1 sugar phosphate isomerase/epimerase [Akkermansia sp. N21116]
MCILFSALCFDRQQVFAEVNALPQKNIALQLYSVRHDLQKDYKHTIQQVRETGYTMVEAANYRDGKFYGLTPEDFKKNLKEVGLRPLSSHVGKELSRNELQSGDFRESLKWWNACIDDHKTAGITYIIVPWLSVPNTLKDLQTYCNYFNEIGKKCRERGLSFGYHNHSHEFSKVEGQLMYDYMIEHTDPKYVFFQMDVYWMVIAQQSPVDYFHKYKGRFELLHIKDKREIGQSGMVGFDAIFRNTDTAGTKYLIVEQEHFSQNSFHGIKQSLKYLQECPLVKEHYGISSSKK